jgi:hypothetical protein
MDELGEKVAMCGEFWELYRIRGRVNAMARAWGKDRLGAAIESVTPMK